MVCIGCRSCTSKMKFSKKNKLKFSRTKSTCACLFIPSSAAVLWACDRCLCFSFASETHLSPQTERSLSKGNMSTAGSIDPGLLDRKKKTVTVDVEGGRYMAMMKILPSGNLIRYRFPGLEFYDAGCSVVGETLPLEANSIASLVVQLHKLHCQALYNIDNCRRFVKRCCQIQGLFSSKTMHRCIQNYAVIQMIEEVLKDALEFFAVFSQR